MNQPAPREPFVLTFPKDQDGQDIKWRFILTISKTKGFNFGTKEKPDTVEQRLIKAVGTIDGVDYVNPDVGRYSIEVAIARTFNPDEVIEELKRRVCFEVLTEIKTPKFIV
jgi:hypothetical protein